MSRESVISISQRRARLVVGRRAEAAEVLGTMRPGCRVIGVTKGLFALLDLVEAVLEQVSPAYVLVSTWTPGKAEMERVLELIESGMISRFHLLVDRSFPTRHKDYVKRVEEICGKESIRMTRTHAKFALIRADDWRVCIRTSMNFNVNPRLEQFDLDDDARIYELFERVADQLFADVGAGLDAEAADVARGFNRVFSRRKSAALESVG